MNKELKIIGKISSIGASFVASFVAVVFGLSAITYNAVGMEIINLYNILFSIISIITGIFFIMLLRVIEGKSKFSRVGISYLLLLIICITSGIGYIKYQEYQSNIPVITARKLNLLEYLPFGSNKNMARLNENPTLLISDNFPKLDGATAFFPVYSAFIEAVYAENEFKIANGDISTSSDTEIHGNILQCSRTETAYQNLITKQVDIIFVLAPSEDQLRLAKANGAELEFIPIGKEGFVFFVNSRNKVDSLTVSQIQDIYSGKITNWKEAGGKWEDIKAFQRDENSGSQTALENLMKGKTIIVPEYQTIEMGMALDVVADYKNYGGAIGYTFKYFATEMEINNDIKFLEVNGVYPSKEAIEDGTYPLTNDFYAVIRKDNENENVHKFINWILSNQGQELVRKTGYAGTE